MLGGEDDSIAMEDEKMSRQEERELNPWWMESTGGFVDHADFERAVEEFEREREEFEREKQEFKRKKEEFKRERYKRKISRKMDASDCSSDATEVYNEVKKKNAQGLAFENHIKQLDITWSTSSEDVYKKITLAKDQYSSLDAEEMEDIISIRLEKLMELEIARVRLQCQELVLQKIAGWDDFKNMKYKEVKDEMRNMQPSFNDAQLQKIFEKSCIDMCIDIGSEQDSLGLISEDLKARILEWLNEEFELLSENVKKFHVILIPIPGERYD